METFTEKEIETARKVYCGYDESLSVAKESLTFEEWLDSLLKPKRKKIVVEIEYESKYSNDELNINNILDALNNYYSEYFKSFAVTEIPEVFTREDISDIFNYTGVYVDSKIKYWLSERESK